MRYVIPVSELSNLVKELRSDGMDYVEISFFEGTPIPAKDPEPAFVSFSAFKKSEPEFLTDYDDIEVVSGFDDIDIIGGSGF